MFTWIKVDSIMSRCHSMSTLRAFISSIYPRILTFDIDVLSPLWHKILITLLKGIHWHERSTRGGGSGIGITIATAGTRIFREH